MKIIDSGYRIDLHIHSHYSCGKDNAKVAFNSLDHVNVLAEKLNDNGVQICAITDHYAFGYDVYKELKKYEYIESSSIIRMHKQNLYPLRRKNTYCMLSLPELRRKHI